MASSRTPTSTGGGSQPVWSPNGRELFYRSLYGFSLLTVEVHGGADLSVGRPNELFERRFFRGNDIAPTFDVSPYGERFLMVEEVPGAAKLHVVLNWHEELKRLDPNARR